MDYLFFEKDDPFPNAPAAEGFKMVENGFVGKAEEAGQIPRLNGGSESVFKNGKAQPLYRSGPGLERLDRIIISNSFQTGQENF
jgi:hypothetical protein